MQCLCTILVCTQMCFMHIFHGKRIWRLKRSQSIFPSWSPHRYIPGSECTWEFWNLKWPSTDTQFVLLEGWNGHGGTSISSPMETEQFILRDGNYKVFEALFSPWFWYDFAADLCCFWTNSCVSNFFHQLQRSENPSFELLSMSKLRVLSIDEKFPANPKTSFRRILEEYEAICSKYRFEVHL